MLLGFGNDRLLHEQPIFRSQDVLLWQAHGCHGRPAAKVVLPARSFFEKSGYWVNEAGQKQYVRQSVRPPLTTPDDLELLSELAGLFAATPQEQDA